MRVSADGGEARAMTTPREASGEVRHAWPAIIPGRRVLLFTIDTMAVDGASGVVAALTLDGGSSEAQHWQTIVAGVDLARAAAPDTILLARGAELDAMAFDPVRLAAAGPPRTVVAPVATAQGLAHYAVTPTGSLIWADAPASSSPTPSGLAWWSPTGVHAEAADITQLRGASLSRDGSRLAGVVIEGSRSDIWVVRCQSRHRDPADAQRNQRVTDLVGGRPHDLLRRAERRRVQRVEPEHGGDSTRHAHDRCRWFAARVPAGRFR